MMEKTKIITVSSLKDDEQLLNVLFNRYRPELYAIALKICGNTGAAEDAVQDALVTAYTHLHQLKNADAFLPWLKRITTNCCYQALRKEKQLLTIDNLPENIKLVDENIEKYFEQITMRDSLYTSLSCLSETLRYTVMLRYLSEFNSYNQIASIMGIPVGTVRSRLNEGKKILLKNWGNQQDADETEFKSANYWNEMYSELFHSVYDNNNILPLIMKNIASDMQIVFTSGKTVEGGHIFETSMYDDFEHGSRISAVHSCITSGNLSVMNVSFANSQEHPNHCPPGSLLTFQREKAVIKKMNLYHALRNDSIATSLYA